MYGCGYIPQSPTPMKLYLPDGLLPFAAEFSRFKTPAERTDGYDEPLGMERGAGDVLDTVGTLMLWHHLAGLGVQVTYILTANEGDEGDLRATTPNGPVTVNVKTSGYDGWRNDPPDVPYHIAVKHGELRKTLPDIFAQVFVHLPRRREDEAAHVHLCGWIHTTSPAFQNQRQRTIPGTEGSRGYWIPASRLGPINELSRTLR